LPFFLVPLYERSERMLKTIFSKVVWVGRAASTVFGLALVLALIFGVATAAFGANGDFFKVGKSNTATKVSKLIKSGVGPALELRVDSGAPLKVNSETKVTNLNADKLDGQSLECPSGTIFHEGVCIETALRTTNATFSTAQTDCLDETETRLPTSAELQTLDGVGRDFSEWSNHAYTDSGNNLGISVNNDASNDTTSVVTQTSSIGYRCVKHPS
jgi:hypothetical protein